MALVGEAPAKTDAGQFLILLRVADRLGAKIQPTMANILRHDQPFISKHAIQTTYRHARFPRNPLRSEPLFTNIIVNQRYDFLELTLAARRCACRAYKLR